MALEHPSHCVNNSVSKWNVREDALKMEDNSKTIGKVRKKFLGIKESALNNEIDISQLLIHLYDRKLHAKNTKKFVKRTFHVKSFPCVATVLAIGVSLIIGTYLKCSSRCALKNNFVLMELSRPATDCRICEGVTAVLVLHNATQETFLKHAYSSRPMLVTGTTTKWSALQTFSVDFFHKIYEDTPGAYESVEEECQFFPFKTKFLNLREALNMPPSRASLLSDKEESWYIGWSNCNPNTAKILRKHYERPHFLPENSEHSVLDWIFMGWSGQGTSMHLDYVRRPSWQAQISGTKTWKILPPPECEEVCHPMNITVHSGDIILLDTNQWYHETFIHPGAISITIGSEYD
ncbi:F-box protein [Nymphon striatum]|nr:F-box protein [Nymphon striatum]